MVHGRRLHPDLVLAQAPLPVGQGPFQKPADGLIRKGFQPEQAGPRDERGNAGEDGVFGGGAHQGDQPAFQVGQQGVLLAAVPTMHLVHKQQGALTLAHQAFPRLGHDPPQVRHPGRHRVQGLEVGAGDAGDDASQRGLAGARRPPENHRPQPVCLDGAAQQPARPYQVLLAGELVQGLGPHPLRQRGRLLRPPGFA